MRKTERRAHPRPSRQVGPAHRDPRIALALLAYGFPGWGPPPEDVTLDDLTHLASASVDDLRRWLQRDEA